jgi:proteic killer suppression protein
LRFAISKGYTRLVIQSFAHKGLARFYRSGSRSGIQAKHAERLRLILSNLDESEGPEDMDLPGLALHELKGKRKGIWAVKVSGNWRVTFRFVAGDVEQVNYEDYH